MRVQRALLAHIVTRLSPARVTLVGSVIKPWASITFSGARYAFTLLVDGPEARRVSTQLRATIGCDEFSIAGHLVADIIVTNMNTDGVSVRLDIEVLMVTDD